MIYTVMLVNMTSRRKVVASDYWSNKLSQVQLKKYLSDFAELKEKSERLKYKSVVIDNLKIFSRECSEDLIIVFVTDSREPDEDITNRINRASRVLRTLILNTHLSHIKKNFRSIVEPFVVARFIIAFVGESGVGKTSLLYLLLGKQPPEEHHPTIALNTEIIKDIRFANLEIMILDFAGQAQSRRLWDLSGTDMVFLVTDSTLKNLIASKEIISGIQRKYPELPIRLFANKQDLPNALDPSAISRVMGLDAESMIAVDLTFRNNLLESLIRILCGYFELEVPDISPDVLLKFADE